MFPVSSLQPNKRKTTQPVGGKKPAQKVDEQQSKDIMNQLFNDLDENEAEDLEEMNRAPQQHAASKGPNGQVAFSKEEEI